MDNDLHFNETLIAPCGINCGTCIAYLREKNRCHGCKHADLNKPKTRLNCRIRNCENLQATKSGRCGDCLLFPCAGMKRLDKRYRTRYSTSLIRNLEMIREAGLSNFLENEEIKWSCPNCCAVLSVHRNNCIKCNLEVRKTGTVSLTAGS